MPIVKYIQTKSLYIVHCATWTTNSFFGYYEVIILAGRDQIQRSQNDLMLQMAQYHISYILI